jgi:uncharacterized protein YkwD
MISKILKLTTILLICISFAAVAGPGKMERDILSLINEYRQKKNLQPLEMVDDISDVAEKHSRNMATNKVPFGHAGFDERIDKLLKDIKGANAAAENVAFGNIDAEKVVDMWLKSKGHKKNIEGNFNLTGIGISEGKDGRLYFTQIFVNRK